MEGLLSNTAFRQAGLVSTLWEYLLVVTPSETISNKLLEVDRGWHRSSRRLKGEYKPYIKLAEFQARESMEETIIRWMQRACNQMESFTVTLNNYGGFPPATIFVRIQDHQPFRSLASKLQVIDDYIQSNSCPAAKFFSKPNLRIGEQPAEADYSRALFHYSQQDFYESFQVNELVLMKSRNVFEQLKQVNLFRLYPPDTHKKTELA
jgi:2'-5' RNA ligase